MPGHKRILLSLATLVALLAFVAPLVRGAGEDRIATLAGGASAGFGGDGGPATAALLDAPSDVAPLAGGAYLVADTSNDRIRKVDANGVITTIAGDGLRGFGGDGFAATLASLDRPQGVTVAPDGSILIADTGNSRIRRVDANGVITTVAGTGTAGFNGDSEAAITAQLNRPEGVAALPSGAFLIADTANNRIRLVDGGGGIATLAGTGVADAGGDGGPATAAQLNAPARVAPLPGGGGAYLIADTGNSLVREVGGDGSIATVAGSLGDGSANPGFSGDGGPATQAQLDAPQGVAALPDGSFLIADSANDRIRKVGADGVIATFAGTGTSGSGGDGGAPTAAQLAHPLAVAADGARTLIADSANARVRAVGPPPAGGSGAGTSTGTDGVPATGTASGTGTGAGTTPVLAPGLPQPVLGKRAVAAPDGGRVLVRLAGTRHFVRLTGRESIPLGSELDTTSGIVSLRFVTDAAGTIARAAVSEGRFVLRQPSEPVDGQLPAELDLSGPLAGCAPPRARGALASAARAPRPTGRRVRVRARGKVRTRGRYGAAVVRGTRWTMVDRCPGDPHPGTFVLVREHVVAVTSFVLRRTVLVSAGHAFLAPARRP
jgi:hypothetical protein